MLTVKLDKVVLAGLPGGTATGLFLGNAHLDGFAVAQQEDDADRNSKGDQDDGEGAKRPAEVDIVQEQLRNLGAGKGGSDAGGGVDAKDDHTVLEGGHVGGDNVDNVQQAEVANPVEGVGGGVHLDVDAGGLHDHAEDDEEDHGAKTLDTAPDVDDLGNGQLGDAAQDRGHDAGGGEQAVLRKGRGDVGNQVALNTTKERVDEAQEVEPGGGDSPSAKRKKELLLLFPTYRTKVTISMDLDHTCVTSSTRRTPFCLKLLSSDSSPSLDAGRSSTSACFSGS